MKPEHLKERNIEKEFVFLTSRSSGPGGQNVNKTSTKVELRFDIFKSLLFTDIEKNLITEKLKNKISNEGILILVSQSERTQLMNKDLVVAKFYDLISKSLTVPKKRRPSKPTSASKKRRLDAKKKHGLLKKTRGDSGYNEE